MVRAILAGLLVLVSAPASAGQDPFFSVRRHPGYARPERSLEELARERGTRRENHFCVVGYRDASAGDHAWVHWKEGRALVLWEPAADPKHPFPLAASRRFLDLERDVVADESELKGSSYLVTRDWVKRVTSDCKKHGEKFMALASRRKTFEDRT